MYYTILFIVTQSTTVLYHWPPQQTLNGQLNRREAEYKAMNSVQVSIEWGHMKWPSISFIFCTQTIKNYRRGTTINKTQ
jgi:hypothetical protein